MFGLGIAVWEILNKLSGTAGLSTNPPAALNVEMLLEQLCSTMVHVLLYAAAWPILSYGMHAMYISELHVFDVRKRGTT